MAWSWVSPSARAALWLVVFTTGCALDTRKLEEDDSNHPVNTAGTSNSGASGSANMGDNGMSHGPSPKDLPVCSYSEKVEAGCATIVDNAGFTSGVDGWAAEPLAITVDWSPNDAEESARSGSILVTNKMHGTNEGLASGAGRQCITVTPRQVFDMAADIYIPDGQGAGIEGGGPYVGQAGLGVFFSASENCAATSRTEASYQTTLVKDPGKWVHIEGAVSAPDTAHSMAVRVLTVKEFKEYTFEAHFDNVLLQRR